MAALAYLLLPVSGFAAYMLGATTRMRFHGLQAVSLGLLWPVALYAGSAVSPGVAQGVFAAGALVWLLLTILAALGRNPRLPLVGRWLERAAEGDPRARD